MGNAMPLHFVDGVTDPSHPIYEQRIRFSNSRTSGEVVILRHRVSPPASPMTGSSGVSSTPRLFDSNISVSAYWIARFRGRRQRRVWRVRVLQTRLRIPAARYARVLRERSAQRGRGATPRRERTLPQEGSGECRAPNAPAVSCAKVESTRGSHHGRTGITRHSRTRWF